MRRLIKIVVSIVLICILGLIALPFLIPVDSMKAKVLSSIQQQTGRQLSIEKISFSVFPDIAFKAQKVKLGNPSWAQGDMADIDELSIGVALMPLLHKQVEVTELTLKSPHFQLIKRTDQANWQFIAPGAQVAPVPNTTKTPQSSGGANVSVLSAKVNIKDGSLTYKDMTTGTTEEVSDINISLKDDGDDKVKLSGSAVYSQKKADITLILTHPFAITAGKVADGELKCSYGAYDFSWKGTLALGATPTITGKIIVPQIDLSAEGETTHKESVTAGKTSASNSGNRWSDDPISFAALSRINGGITLQVEKLLLRKSTLKDIQATIRLGSGALSLATNDISAYGGVVKLTLNASIANAASTTLSVTGVQAEPLLIDLANMSNLSGTLDGQIRLSTRGASERAMVGALEGDGNFHFKNGVWKGRNILSMAKGLGSAFESDGDKTEFSELSGSFTMQNGIATNKDLKLTSSLLTSGGEGTVDLPQWQVQYLLKPVVASALSVPIRIQGSLDKPSYKPDMQAALKENLGDPSKLKDNAKQLKQNLGGALQGVLR